MSTGTHILVLIQSQQKFSDVCSLERTTHVWYRIMQGLPAGQLPSSGASDTLPTILVLKFRRYKADATCLLCCSVSPTTLHILNGCTTALTQSRYPWRHDSVLLMLVVDLWPVLAPGQHLFMDLDGYHSCDHPQATILLHVLTVSARHDTVLVKPSEVIMLELTVPFNSPESLACAKVRKMVRLNYQMVQSDLEARGFNASLLTIVTSCLGHSPMNTQKDVCNILPAISKSDCRQLFGKSCKVAISTSYSIVMARRELV